MQQATTATDISTRDYPDLPDVLIERPHLLELLKQMMTVESPVVFIEGEAGSGRTTLCAQFIEANRANTFHLFIKPASKLAYNPDYLRELLSEQLHRWIGGTEARSTIDVSEYEPLLLKARRKARTTPIYIVVDGIDDIPKEDARFVEQIFRDVLPIGVDPFRFLIAADHEPNSVNLGKTKAKTFQAITLSPSESEALLSGVCDDPETRMQLEKLCKGNPGRIWSVRRLLKSGATAGEILRSEPTRLLEFVRLEFSALPHLEDPHKLVIAALAFGRQEFAATDLSLVCKIPEESVASLVKACIFLRTNEQTGAIEFLSETHRSYAARQLQDFQPRAIALQIEALKADPTCATAVRLLPSYYQQARNQRAIVELLSPEHYRRLLEVSQSISALKLRAALGSRSAEELSEVTHVFRFALQRSIFAAIGDMSKSESEVEALVALGEPQRALQLAAQAAAKDSRLAMLATYGRQVVENGGSVDQQTINFIRETASQIEFSELGEQADEIASNLVFVDADLAFQIIEESSRERGQKEKDVAYAKVSIDAAIKSFASSGGVLKAAREKVTDKGIQLMLSSISLLAEKFSFDEVKSIAESMEVGRRIHFLRALAVAGATWPAVLDVVEYALDQIVGETGYLPKPKDLSDLAYPLTKSGDSQERRAKLIKRIEGQLALVGRVATSVDSVRMQLRLAHAEFLLGIQSAPDRIVESYYEVSSIENLEIRAECLALMLHALMSIDSQGDLERAHGLKAVIASDLQEAIEALLSRTAQHFQVAKSSIRAISRVNSVEAYELAGRLNTQDRRERAMSELVNALTSEEHTQEREETLRKATASISSADFRDAAILGGCQSAGRKGGAKEWVLALSSLLGEVRSPETRSECALILLKAARDSELVDVSDLLERSVVEAVERIDAPLERADALFSLSSTVARSDLARAAEYYDAAKDIRSGLILDCESAVEVVGTCVSLLSRAFAPAAKHSLLTDDLVNRYARLVDTMPGKAAKASCYANLVTRIWCEGKSEQATELSKKYLIPLLEEIDATDRALAEQVGYTSFPALYVTTRALAIRVFEALSTANREHAISMTIRMFVRGSVPSDPTPPSDDGPPAITYAQALEAIELLNLSTVDSSFYLGTKEIVDAISHSDNRYRVNAGQKRDVATKLSELAGIKLPDRNNIYHDGYVIVTSAQIGRLNEERQPFWTELVQRAHLIPNVADRAFVLLELSECLPAKFSDLKNSTLENSITSISEIPSGLDRFGRLEYYVQIVRERNVPAAKAALREAIKLTYSMPQRDQVPKCRREIADLADSIEPGLAEKLIEASDDDPARMVAREEMRRLASVQRARRQISQAGENVEQESLSVRNLPTAAWKNIGALVAGRIATQQPNAMMTFLSASGGFDLDDASPVLAWFVENCGRRFRTVASAAQFTLPLAEILLTSSELGVDVIAQLQARRLRSSASADDAAGMLVRHRDREEAMTFIANWLKEFGGKRVILCDPFFSSADIDFIGLFLKEAPTGSQLVVLASKGSSRFVQEEFETAWRRRFDQDPPDVEVILVSGTAEKGVLHDRWLVTSGSGLRLGTSINSIGRGKLSEISVLEQGRDETILSQLELYASRTKVVDGQRLQYVSFQI